MEEKELTIEEKIENIKNTNSYKDIVIDWFPPYHADEYYFVSYSHRDYKLVFESLHRLQSGAKHINVWYDRDLGVGRDWETEAGNHICNFNCKGVIFFISENAVLSASIHKEIEFVKNNGKEYLSINLPCEKIKGHEGEYLSASKMLTLLKEQGEKVSNYDAKLEVLGETFNDNITFIPFDEHIDLQIAKIYSLKRQQLLNIKQKTGANHPYQFDVISLNDINVTEIREDDFKYLIDEPNQYDKSEFNICDCCFAN